MCLLKSVASRGGYDTIKVVTGWGMNQGLNPAQA
jgi:hypothetical protein